MIGSNESAGKLSALTDPAICLGLIVIALVIGLFDLHHSGEQWLEDGPRYCNNGAMMHDWMVGGNWLDPIGFAKQNYTQYPAHSVPFHPPGYAFLLGSWFLAVGMSYTSARVFIALCLGLALCFFYGILRRQRIVPWIAAAGPLLLATSPEIGRWSRTTMSEIPGMMFILAGSYCFVRAVDTNRGRWSWLAFVLAELAFFCRVTTAGVLPAWVLFLLVTKGFRRTVSAHVVLPAIVYLAISGVWVKFASAYASYEVGQVGEAFSDGVLGYLASGKLFIWFQGLPGMVGGITLAAAVCGMLLAVRDQQSRADAWFWIFWFLSCYLFQVAQFMHFEPRYFMFSVPAVCALAGANFVTRLSSRAWRSVAVLVIAAATVQNTVSLYHLPRGLQGFEAVAGELADQDDRGNILVSSWSDSDLIFRYRCHPKRQNRQLVRGDRVLAIRLPYYAHVAPTALAESVDDVLDIIRRGRIRYIVTTPPSYPAGSSKDRRHADMALLHAAALAAPEQFTLIRRYPLILDFGSDRREEAFLWRFEGELPEGESELPVLIPTANMDTKQLDTKTEAGQGKAE